jgi:ribosomal-protein-alanine N-acetyltransferase
VTRAVEHGCVSIQDAAPAHAAELARVHGGLFASPWSAHAVARLLEHPGATSLLARIGDPPQTVGFIIGRVAVDEAEILSLGVSKELQRRGIGRRLVAALADAASRAGARRLFLEVGQHNGAALALYRGLGFSEVGRRSGYYVHAGAAPEDAIVLAVML